MYQGVCIVATVASLLHIVHGMTPLGGSDAEIIASVQTAVDSDSMSRTKKPALKKLLEDRGLWHLCDRNGDSILQQSAPL